ncbi:MAG: type II secretion system protein [FCB group bacterium]|nr:type II secretion system protein [FCB group bacterium]
MRKKQAGFSLVELMIVLVIIGILAAVGVPIYTSNMNKARQSEADATLGTIRTDLRVYYAEHEEYPNPYDGAAVAGAAWNNILASDLDGKYFDNTNYTYTSTDGTDFTLTCAANGILNADRTLNAAGVFSGGMD